MDNELFELSKEVYRRTGWVHGGRTVSRHESGATKEWTSTYDSDYLLEKLKSILLNEEHKVLYLQLHHIDRDRWRAGYKSYQYVHADTPLKALLKLVIALDDKGVSL